MLIKLDSKQSFETTTSWDFTFCDWQITLCSNKKGAHKDHDTDGRNGSLEYYQAP